MRKNGRRMVLAFCLLFAARLVPGAAESPRLPSQMALEGFYAAAFASEYADTERGTLLRWEAPLVLFVQGAPTKEDEKTLETFLCGLKDNVKGLPEISFTQEKTGASVILSFVPLSQMAEHLNYYVEGNWGFMNCLSDDTGIRFGMIAVASDVTSQEDRNHLIQEEFVNMLGLTADIDFAKESIIYQPYTVTQRLAPMDYEMLSLLYGPYVKTGMTQAEARAAIGAAFPQNK